MKTKLRFTYSFCIWSFLALHVYMAVTCILRILIDGVAEFRNDALMPFSTNPFI